MNRDEDHRWWIAHTPINGYFATCSCKADFPSRETRDEAERDYLEHRGSEFVAARARWNEWWAERCTGHFTEKTAGWSQKDKFAEFVRLHMPNGDPRIQRAA